ncbi:MAG: low affinity iron permease family protein [Actinomycetota bacterium]|nr:low affinity iron permease family protein [Actinomycetota bacterium]
MTAKRSEPDTHRGLFDRFAEFSSNTVSHAPFFAFCVLLVVLWAPTYVFVRNFDTWQLLINTPTTILTFLLVAILQNSQRRAELALQHKLDALADGLADLMEHFVGEDDDEALREDLVGDIHDLKESIGLEKRVSTSE